MSRRFFIIGSIAGVLGASLAASIYIVFTSLWYLEALIPATYEPEAVIGFTSSRSIAPYRSLAQEYLADSTEQAFLSFFNKFILARSSNATILVGLPSIRAQRQIIPAMQQSGWEVERMGLLIYATRTNDNTSLAHTPYVRAFATAVGQYKRFNAIKNPRAIVEFQPQSYSLIDQSYKLVVFSDSRGVIGEVYVSGSTPPIGLYESLDSLSEGIPTPILSVHGPGALVTLVPQVLEEQIDRYISAELGFARLRTGFVNSLKNQPQLLIQKTPQGVVIGAGGSRQSFVTEVEAWLQSELAYHNPVRTAFRLPDGTLGYEYVPGEQAVQYEAVNGDTNCRSANQNNTEVWLCAKENRAAIGTDYELARQYIESTRPQGAPWHVILSAGELSDTTAGEYVGNIIAIFSGEKALMRIEAKD